MITLSFRQYYRMKEAYRLMNGRPKPVPFTKKHRMHSKCKRNTPKVSVPKLKFLDA